MEQQKVLEAKTKAKSLLQAKWFPGAIASVALVIAIGGHAFTGWNSVGLAKLWNQVEGLEAFKLLTQRSDIIRIEQFRHSKQSFGISSELKIGRAHV